ncbi:MAG: hypothetical protein KatS3mg091_126 [Patescibacteria group bacterium]|nr:MAG: hypothetical protein KatS3mg091_126 [Patescibacteria group bacterium]
MQDKKTFLEYLFGFFLGVNFFFLCLLYLFLQKNTLNLYIINKAVANTALLLIITVLFIGPLSRLYNWPDILVSFRKEIGISGFIFAVIHTFLSFLPNYYNLNRYFQTFNPSFYAAITAILILTILFILSFEKIIAKLPRSLWWKIQYRGVRTVFILVIIHFLLKNISKWKIWMTTHSSLPDLSFIIFILCIFLLIFRVTEYLNRKLAKFVFTGGLIITIIFYLYLFL